MTPGLGRHVNNVSFTSPSLIIERGGYRRWDGRRAGRDSFSIAEKAAVAGQPIGIIPAQHDHGVVRDDSSSRPDNRNDRRDNNRAGTVGEESPVLFVVGIVIIGCRSRPAHKNEEPLQMREKATIIETKTTPLRSNYLRSTDTMPTSSVPAQQRRVFRGRGGPKDGRLPPKKKKKTPAVRYVAGSKYPLPPSQDDYNDDDDDYDGEKEKEDGDAPVTSSANHNNNSNGRNDVDDADDEPIEEKGQEGAAVDNDEQCAMLELRHLQQRIQNIRTSMTLSKGKQGGGQKNHSHRAAPSSSSVSSSLTIPHYSANVLNAILNAVVEWHAIYTRYYYAHPDDDDDSYYAGSAAPSSSAVLSLLSDAPPHVSRPRSGQQQQVVVVIREMGDLVFAMIQQGLQCGPLVGAKPGYFKRCGSEIAGLVHAFLVRVVEYLPLSSSSDDDGGCAFWSERQQSALASWMANAEKATAAHQEPSRSVQKKMLSGRR
jgi:hypothetical protein